jgi:hypothetical protein
MAQVGADGSYLSQSHSDLHFGLNEQSKIDEITLFWPDGFTETVEDIDADQLVLLTHTAVYPVAGKTP